MSLDTKSMLQMIKFGITKQISNKELTCLIRQIATLLNAGILLNQAINLLLNNQPAVHIKIVLNNLKNALEAGVPTSKAMQLSCSKFTEFDLSLIMVADQTGNLNLAFSQLAKQREKHEHITTNVRKALTYPCLVIISSAAALYFLLTIVIPEFYEIFHNFNACLPWFTQALLNISSWLQKWGLISILLTSSMLAILYVIQQKIAKIQLVTHSIALKLPIIGKFISHTQIVRFANALANCLNADLKILPSMINSAKMLSNLKYRLAINDIYHKISSGMPLYIAMRGCQLFPPAVLQMIMIGEESHTLGKMLLQIAQIYEAQLDDSIDRLTKLLEPCVIVLLGIVIGIIIIAMYLPIFDLITIID